MTNKHQKSITSRFLARLGIMVPVDYQGWGLGDFIKGFFRDYWRNILFQMARNNFLFGPTIATQVIRPMLNRWRGAKIGKQVGIGEGTTIGLTYPEYVTIGDHCRISANVVINEHGRDLMRYHSGMPLSEVPVRCKAITIEDNCHIGMGAIILAGVTIGQGAIIGAGAVVRENVPAYALVIGNPGKVVASFDVSSEASNFKSSSAELQEN